MKYTHLSNTQTGEPKTKYTNYGRKHGTRTGKADHATYTKSNQNSGIGKVPIKTKEKMKWSFVD